MVDLLTEPQSEPNTHGKTNQVVGELKEVQRGRRVFCKDYAKLHDFIKKSTLNPCAILFYIFS